MTFIVEAPEEFSLKEQHVMDHATQHGFELVEGESSAAEKWWRWRNRQDQAGWFRTRREAAYWMYQWLARNGHYA
jgi:hypothetical protein